MPKLESFFVTLPPKYKPNNRMNKKPLLLMAFFACFAGIHPSSAQATKKPAANTTVPPAVHPTIGTEAKSTDGELTIRLIAKKQNFGGKESNTHDTDIHSPKSINIHPDGTKYYVNSLEGCTTISYDFRTNKKLRVIRHTFKEGRDDQLWAPASGLYPWRHYNENLNTFSGKPVESTFSHQGRYLWVPYYRRTFDINAQDPSAVAVIDTETDSIVRLLETGPLPKMITTSPDGTLVAISHWGNNTVGLIDISSENPADWHHTKVLTVDYELKLDFPLDKQVDRDNDSGYALRGTVFTPDGNYLLVGCMGGGGGIAVINARNGVYLGRVMGMMANVRHILISHGYLYLSINRTGYVQRIKLDKFMQAAQQMKNKIARVSGWESCQVGSGARTISITPDGRYVFAACNLASALYVVDTQTMKVVCTIPVDSYPVGLDLSTDGCYVFTTSQGRKQQGGNAVNIFRVEYKHPPVVEKGIEMEARRKAAASPEKDGEGNNLTWLGLDEEKTTTVLLCGGSVLLVLASTLLYRHFHHSQG